MAKFKSTAKKNSGGRAAPAGDDAGSGAERLSASLTGSAQQIWLAGVGALGRAQAEGNRLFEGLVRDGVTLEKTARSFAGHRAEVVREVVETGVGQARERATDTWDRLEKVFEDRVQRALVALGVPGREDLRDLSGRVDALTAELRKQNARAGAAAGRKAPAAGAPAAAGAGGLDGKRPSPAAAKAAPGPAQSRTRAGKTAVRKAPARRAGAAARAGDDRDAPG
ncbi:MAG TPA: phasin family protein [Luteimonas sp.]|nr:phasin family protein [Luteimonas sp.]